MTKTTVIKLTQYGITHNFYRLFDTLRRQIYKFKVETVYGRPLEATIKLWTDILIVWLWNKYS